MSITLRNVKGSPLTHEEMDGNFSALTSSIVAGDGLDGGGSKSGSIEFSVDSTVARRNAANTFTSPQDIQSSLTASSADISIISGSSVTYTSGSVDRIDTISGEITTLTGTNLTYTSGSVDRVDSVSAGITTLSGSSLTYTSSSLDRINSTSGEVTTITGTDITYTSGSIGRIDSTSGGITTLSGSSVTYTSASLDRIDSTSGGVTTITGTDLTYTSGSLSRLDVSGNGEVQGDLTVGGTVTAQEFHTEFVSASIIFESGSSKFGDDSNDIHSFSGSLRVTGSGDHFFTDGNVGIGTSTPGNTLHVFKNATVGTITSTTLTNAGLRIQDSAANMYLDGNSITLDSTGYITTTGGNDLVLGTNNTARVHIDALGNVGIGLSLIHI